MVGSTQHAPSDAGPKIEALVLAAVFALAAAVPQLAFDANLWPFSRDLDSTLQWTLGLQFGIIIGLAAFSWRLPPAKDFDKELKGNPNLLIPKADPKGIRTENAKTAAHQFVFFWRWLWALWIILYLVFWFKALYCPVNAPAPCSAAKWLDPIDDVAFMLNGSAFFLCYFVMVIRTTEDGREKHDFQGAVIAALAVYVILPIMAMGYAMARQNAMAPQEHVPKWLPWLEALLSGVALTLLAGRLESPLIGSPKSRSRHFVASGLYAYALLQVAYVLLAGPHSVVKLQVLPEWQARTKLGMLNVALVGKILLYWYVTQTLLKNGGLYWYMFAYRKHQDDDGIFVACPVSAPDGESESPKPIAGIFRQAETGGQLAMTEQPKATEQPTEQAKVPRRRQKAGTHDKTADKPQEGLITIDRETFLRELLVKPAAQH